MDGKPENQFYNLCVNNNAFRAKLLWYNIKSKGDNISDQLITKSIIDASRSCSIDVVKWLFDIYPNIFPYDDAFCAACSGGSIEIVKLINRKVGKDIRQYGFYKAVLEKRVQVCKFLKLYVEDSNIIEGVSLFGWICASGDTYFIDSLVESSDEKTLMFLHSCAYGSIETTKHLGVDETDDIIAYGCELSVETDNIDCFNYLFKNEMASSIIKKVIPWDSMKIAKELLHREILDFSQDFISKVVSSDAISIFRWMQEFFDTKSINNLELALESQAYEIASHIAYHGSIDWSEEDYYMFVMLCSNGMINEAEFVTVKDEGCLKFVNHAFVECLHDYLINVLKWLHDLGADPHVFDDIALEIAATNNAIECFKWLQTEVGGFNLKANGNRVFRRVCEAGAIDVARHLAATVTEYYVEEANGEIIDYYVVTDCDKVIHYFSTKDLPGLESVADISKSEAKKCVICLDDVDNNIMTMCRIEDHAYCVPCVSHMNRDQCVMCFCKGSFKIYNVDFDDYDKRMETCY